ncbi:unnamed protein product [Blepharisma stoltei]|uniref:Uncharacterized protein n=1 Tax=Blepharisma stoltei TaxID=1481888 RepID=A0AAU9K4V0_9CILI|nr:unnamed protein product [Blepharisma stoltei]
MASSYFRTVSIIWPPWELRSHKSSISLIIYPAKLFLLSGIFTHIMITFTVISACMMTFDCWDFLPTISYIGYFKGYDRIFVLTLSAFNPVLLLFFSAAFANYDATLSKIDSITMLFTGIIISFAVPFAFIIDEAGSSFYVPLEQVHLVIVAGMIMLGMIWVTISLKCMYKLKNYSLKQSRILQNFLIYLGVCLSMLLITICLWYNSANITIEWIEAIFEYIAVSLSIYLPFAYSLSFQVTKITISVRSLNHSLLSSS